jgi:branched-chain amino acid transport system ATP-binding protein
MPVGESTPILELRSVCAGYGRLEVVHGVDLALRRGELMALLGPNGAGKSTTVRVAAGMHQPSRGAVRVGGRRINGVSPRRLARCGVCLLPEGRGVFPNLTVRENLWMATHAGVTRGEVEEVSFRIFPRLGERRSQLAGTLSGGEQQMLAMARALAVKPTVLLLDELSMGLAPLVVKSLYEIVAGIAAEGVSVLAVEQFARAVLPLADRAAIMVNGRIVADGPPSRIEAELEHHYLGGPDER